MKKPAKDFLMSILGADGLQMLTKASESYPSLSSVFFPKAVLSWLDVVQKAEYRGVVPGLDNVQVRFEQNATNLSTPGQSYTFGVQKEDLAKTAAVLLVSFGEDAIDQDVKQADIGKLAKSLDLLVKSKSLAWVQVSEESSSSSEESSSEESLSEGPEQEASEPEVMEKIDLPGKAAPAWGPKPPEAPEPQKKAPKMGTAKKPPFQSLMRTESFAKSELRRVCKTCGSPQLHKRWNILVGCNCISPLLKSEKPMVDVSLDRETYKITGDSDTISILKELTSGDDSEMA